MPFPVLGSNSAVAAGYEIDNSLRFNDDDTAYLNKTLGTATNRKIWTYSIWVKRGNLGSQQNMLGADAGGNTNNNIRFRTDNAITFFHQISGADTYYLNTNQVFRDVSAWYHLVFVFNSTEATSTDRLKMYVNGSQVTSFSSTLYPSLNLEDTINSNVSHEIGRRGAGMYADFYMSETHFIDGQALAPTDFGETNDNGVWIPKEYEGTYGNNGFYLKFADSGDPGVDSSGNGNDFTSNNLTAQDNTTDTPTNNFCTWNPLQINVNDPPTAFEEGNTVVNETSDDDWSSTAGTQAISNGKWYWEVKFVGGGSLMVGAIRQAYASTTFQKTSNAYAGSDSGDYGFNYRNNGIFYTNGSSTSGKTTFGDTDIVMIALDMDNQAIYTGVNGTWNDSGDPTSGASKTGASYTGIQDEFYSPTVSMSSADLDAQANFGNPAFTISSGNSDANGYGNFEYAVPSGYYALCTKNLAEYG